jgi:hypothetical protein
MAAGMPALLNITIAPNSSGTVISLDICHPAQALDTAGAVMPMALPVRFEERVAAPMFGAAPPYVVQAATDYIPEINPPPPR